jgi:hypothetical protein
MTTRGSGYRRGFVCLLFLAGVVGCGKGNGSISKITGPSPVLTAVRINGPSRLPGGLPAVQYSATAVFSDDTTKDVTTEAKWDFDGFTNWFTAPGAIVMSGRGRGTLSAKYQSVTGLLVVSVLENGTFILNGVVNDSDGKPLDEATVDVVSGTGTGLSVSTDIGGRFAIYGVVGSVQIKAWRGGYTPQTRDLNITTDGQTEAFSLAQMTPSADLAGRWTMTVDPGPACSAGLPAIARGRPYTIQFLGEPSHFFVKTSGPTLEEYNVATDPGSIVGSAIQWTFVGDTNYGEWSWANIIDHLSASENFQFSGTVTGTLSGNEIRATLDGDLGYWNYNLNGDKPTWFCRAHDHVVVLKR